MITKSELKRYNRLQDQKDDLAKEIVLLRTMAESASAISYSGVRIQASNNGSIQENYVEKIDKLISRYRAKINELTELRERIEDEVASLSDEDQQLIRLRYFDGMSCADCAKRLYVSLREFHYWHSDVLVKLAQKD